MPRNFDELLSKDRAFTVRGETFTYYDVKPEVLSGFEMNGEADVWAVIDAQILLFLSAEDQKRWKALRKRASEPVKIEQMNEILKWLLEEQTGRPTQAPSPSGPGPGRIARSSTAESR